MNYRLTTYCAVLLVLITFCPAARAETGYEAWLRYAALTDAARSQYSSLPETVTVLGDSPLLASAQSELVRGVQGMLGRPMTPSTGIPNQPAIVLGTLADLNKIGAALHAPSALNSDGYWLTTARIHGVPCIIITGLTDRGVLYGAFAWLSALARNQNVNHLDHAESPFVPLRWVNQWDNLDGTIERGYGGRSIFWENGAVRSDLTRARDYARLLASIGINGCVINNVNANPHVLADDFIPQIARVADEFRPWGIRLGLSVNFAQPKANRRTRHVRSARSQSRRMVESEGRRDLSRHSRLRRLRAESRFRRPSGSLNLRPNSRRRRQRGRARARSRTAACSSIAASSTTITWTGPISRTIAPRPPTTTSIRSTASSTTT